MLVVLLRWLLRRGRAPQRLRRRTGCTGCLLLILGLGIAVLLLSLLFGGFQKGIKAAAGQGGAITRAAPAVAAGRAGYQP